MAIDRKKLWNDAKELGVELTPIGMFRARPADYPPSGHWSCPGLLWLPGLIVLFALHVACFAVFFKFWFQQGYHNKLLVILAPLAVIWLVFVSADIKFRLQKPTKAQRNGFDNSVINHFGIVAYGFGFLVGVPAMLFAFVSFLWQRLH